MGENLSEGLRIVFTVVLSCLVIGFGFTIWTTVKEAGNTGITDVNSTITMMDESKYTDYDAAEITGSEVINVIKRFQNNEIYIGVDVGSGMVGYIYSDSSLSSEGADLSTARDKTSSTYISPNAKFIGKVVRDDTTNAILGIEFTKS